METVRLEKKLNQLFDVLASIHLIYLMQLVSLYIP